MRTSRVLSEIGIDKWRTRHGIQGICFHRSSTAVEYTSWALNQAINLTITLFQLTSPSPSHATNLTPTPNRGNPVSIGANTLTPRSSCATATYLRAVSKVKCHCEVTLAPGSMSLAAVSVSLKVPARRCGFQQPDICLPHGRLDSNDAKARDSQASSSSYLPSSSLRPRSCSPEDAVHISASTYFSPCSRGCPGCCTRGMWLRDRTGSRGCGDMRVIMVCNDGGLPTVDSFLERAPGGWWEQLSGCVWEANMC